MKRLASPDSLAGLMPICPTTGSDEQSPRNNSQVYTREFQTMLEGLDEEGCIEESSHVQEKKRRLSVDQVKALEKNFEVENKLEPERKVKLAQELGLQPRQVAVWFQNRRARWKTKQLERDYGVLKANHDALKLDYDSLKHDNETLLKEIGELKAKLQEDKTRNPESNISVKEEIFIKQQPKSPPLSPLAPYGSKDLDNFNNKRNGLFKDGSSDCSDSSAILHEDNSPNGAISSSNGLLQGNPSVVMSPTSSSLNFNHCSASSPSSTMNCFQFQPQQYVKMEEHSLYSTDEACDFFSDVQAPTLQWYCPDQWN